MRQSALCRDLLCEPSRLAVLRRARTDPRRPGLHRSRRAPRLRTAPLGLAQARGSRPPLLRPSRHRPSPKSSFQPSFRPRSTSAVGKRLAGRAAALTSRQRAARAMGLALWALGRAAVRGAAR
jgi:hypothetical protein